HGVVTFFCHSERKSCPERSRMGRELALSEAEWESLTIRMAADSGSDPKVEIAHVLTMDVVEYSTLLITEQSRIMARLTEIVQRTARFRQADAEGKLLRLPTG